MIGPGRRVAGLLDILVESLGLTDRLDHRPSELSGGQQQRVAIARALITGPEVVFADEPTGALDSRTAATLLGFLRHSCRELGQTIVMVTHDPIAASYADRALLLSDGRITDAIADPDTDAVLAASIFHFGEVTVGEAKQAMTDAGVMVRPVGR